MQFIEHETKDKDITQYSESNWENIMQFPSIILRNRTRKRYAYAASKY